MFLGVDLGTSRVKTLALDENGKVLIIRSQEYAILHPVSGYSEQSPEDWWHATCNCIKSVLESNIVSKKEISAIGLSGQMHGLVMLDSLGIPLRNAIIWPDNRTIEICKEWSSLGYSEQFYPITGLPLATGFMAPSLEWVKRHEPDIYRSTAKVLLPKDYIRYRLTGKIATERSDACGTYLFDIVRGDWSNELINTFCFTEQIFPVVKDTLSISGFVTEMAAQETGLNKGIPVATGGSDQAMAAIGLEVTSPGSVAVAISTGGTVITTVETPLIDHRLHTLCHAYNNRWLMMGATLSAGIAISWFLKNVLLKREKTDGNIVGIEKYIHLADKIPPGSDGLFFAPYLSGERTPHLNANAKGAFVGLTLLHGQAHMIRSIMEGVAYSMCDSIDIFHELNLPIRELICYAGGSKSLLWRQILADIFDFPVQWKDSPEKSALGAAIAGAIALGKNYSLMNNFKKGSTTNIPKPENVKVYQEQRQIFKNIYQQLVSVFDEISKINSTRKMP